MTKIPDLTQDNTLEDRNLFAIFNGSRTVSIEAAIVRAYVLSGINLTALPRGTLAGKPSGMKAGQPWLDIADSNDDPVLRVTLTAT